MAPAAFPASMAAEKLGKGSPEHGPAIRRSVKGGRIQCGRRKKAPRGMAEGAEKSRAGWPKERKPCAGWLKERKSPVQDGRRSGKASRRMVEGAVAPRRMAEGAEKPRAGVPKERESPGKGQGRDGT